MSKGLPLFGTNETCSSILLVRGGYQSRFAEIVFCLQVFDFRFIGSVDNSDGYGEDGIALPCGQLNLWVIASFTYHGLFSYSIIYHIMIWCHLLFLGKSKILHAWFVLL